MLDLFERANPLAGWLEEWSNLNDRIGLFLKFAFLNLSSSLQAPGLFSRSLREYCYGRCPIMLISLLLHLDGSNQKSAVIQSQSAERTGRILQEMEYRLAIQEWESEQTHPVRSCNSADVLLSNRQKAS